MSQYDLNAPIKPGCLGRIVRWGLVALGVLFVLATVLTLGEIINRLDAIERNIEDLATAKAVTLMSVPPTNTPPPTDTPLPADTPGPTDTTAPPTATKQPTQTPQPTATPTTTQTPLPTATATHTPLPTATPTSTPLPPTATPRPTKTPTATPSPTATPDPSLPRTDTESRIACNMSEYFVKQNLKSPATARFPGIFDEPCVALFNDGVWTLSSYVDSQNSFGAMIRTHYVAQLTYTEEDETWRLQDLVFLD